MTSTIPNINQKRPSPDTNNSIGHVYSVSATRIIGIYQPSISSESPQNVGIGTMVRMAVGSELVFGMVQHMSISDSGPNQTRQKMMEIDLIGEASFDDNHVPHFNQGISTYPLLEDPIWVAEIADIACIYETSGSTVRIGSIHQAKQVPACLITDELLNKHFAILGSTGSGKSSTTALVLRSILNAHPHGHVIMLDPHNEYSAAFPDLAEVFKDETLQIPHWLLNLEELSELLIPVDVEDRQLQINILKKVLKKCRESYGEDEKSHSLIDRQVSSVTVDSPTPYTLKEFIRQMNHEMGLLGNSSQVGPYLQMLGRLESLMQDIRYRFMFSRRDTGDTLQALIESMLRIPVKGKPIAILDLSGMPSEAIDVVVSVLSRLIFDFALWTHHSPRIPVLLVCEEAHRYVPGDASEGFAPTRRALSRIAKEGRKYGISLGLITQRPSELSSTILSQCGTLITLRMSNDDDQQFISKALPDSSGNLLEILPALRPQEAVVVGQGVAVPMRIRFDFLAEEHRPKSSSIPFSVSWKNEHASESFVEKTIDSWRQQKS